MSDALALPTSLAWQIAVVVALGGGAAMLGAAVYLIAIADRRRARVADATEARIAALHDQVARAIAQRRGWRGAALAVGDVATFAAIDRALGAARRREIRPAVDLRSLDGGDDRVH
jgi:hypothetical protein